MRVILLTMAVFTIACGGSSSSDQPTIPPAPAPQPAQSQVGFTIVENGRTVVAPAADGSFTMDGPTTFVISADGTLSQDGTALIQRSGDRIITASGTELAQVTDAGLRFGDQGELLIAADGTLSTNTGGQGTETIQVQGLTDANRRAALTVLAWLMVTEPADAATQPVSAAEADCLRVIDHAIELGVMQNPEGQEGPPPPEARAALAKQCAEVGMEAEAIECFTAATNAQQWADCDKKY